MKDYDLIIFDCDGTLVDTEFLNNKITSDVLIEFGLAEYTPEKCIKTFAGMSWNDIKKNLDSKHNVNIPQQVIDDYIKRVHAEMETVDISVKNAVDFVHVCDENYKIAVGSNGERPNVIRSLNLGGFDDYFHEENIFTKIQVKNGKPAPDLFLFTAEQMGADPMRCLVIEDSWAGATAGVAAGMDVWGFTGVSHDKKMSELRLIEAGASQIFDNFIHMGQVLKL